VEGEAQGQARLQRRSRSRPQGSQGCRRLSLMF
jgi:hypothetical protein